MISPENIQNFSSLSDEEIRRRINEAAAKGKISPEKLKFMLSDTQKIRNLISRMRPEDVERMLKIIGKENAEKMADILKGTK